MRTEIEIREKLKEIENRMSSEEFFSSSATPNLMAIHLLKWVLGEYEYKNQK